MTRIPLDHSIRRTSFFQFVQILFTYLFFSQFDVYTSCISGININKTYVKVMKRRIDDSASSVSDDYGSAVAKTCTELFDVWPVSRFDREFPYFRLPSEVGSFSLDASRVYVDSRSHLRVYSPPSDRTVAWDLSHGYSDFIQRDESKKEYIDHLLKWAQLNGHSRFRSSISDADVCKDSGDISM